MGSFICLQCSQDSCKVFSSLNLSANWTCDLGVLVLEAEISEMAVNMVVSSAHRDYISTWCFLFGQCPCFCAGCPERSTTTWGFRQTLNLFLHVLPLPYFLMVTRHSSCIEDSRVTFWLLGSSFYEHQEESVLKACHTTKINRMKLDSSSQTLGYKPGSSHLQRTALNSLSALCPKPPEPEPKFLINPKPTLNPTGLLGCLRNTQDNPCRSPYATLKRTLLVHFKRAL